MRSVVSKPLVLTVAPTMPRAAAQVEAEAEAGAEAEAEAGAGADPEPEPEPAWPEPTSAARPALREVAKRTAAMLEERMAQVSGG